MGVRLRSLTAAVVMILFLMAGFAFAQGKVDINTANVKQLMSLKSIGKQKAEAIIKYRQMHGPFQSLDDLQHVPGIGKKTVANNKGMITISQGMQRPSGAAASGKAQAERTTQGAMKQGEKAMSGAMEKAKKGMVNPTEKAKQMNPAK
jgi:competence protein ComEA